MTAPIAAPVNDEIIKQDVKSSNIRSKEWIRYGTKEYRNTGGALFLVGFSSFSMIYCVQPLLPAFAQSFSVTPAEASLVLSLTSGFLAFSIFLMGAVSQMFERRNLIFTSMFMGAILNFVASILPNWHALLIARALEGFVLGGVPAVAMAYIAEEIEPAKLGKSMGLYVGGTAFGAMMGRVGMGLLTEFTSWRVAMGGLGVLCIVSAIGFLYLIPPSRNFVPQKHINIAFHIAAWRRHLRNFALIKLYVIGFAITSIFVTLFNYTTFRLSGAPFNLTPTSISMLFLAFGFGIISSSLAGNLSDKFGKKPLLIFGFTLMFGGVLVTLIPTLPAIIVGIILVTTGFFIGHSVASSSVGPLAGNAKSHAASLYLLFYYMGSSIIGSTGGYFWHWGGWGAVVALTASFAILGIVVSYFVNIAPKQ